MPNFLVLLTDQQHFRMLSAAGNRHLSTPNLDALAEEGMRFDLAYATNPICVPSRLSFQTGMMPSRFGVSTNTPRSPIPIPDEVIESSLAPSMRRAGYRTVFSGKKHVPFDFKRLGWQELPGGDERIGTAEACADFLASPAAGTQPFLLFASLINPHDICYGTINGWHQQRGEPLPDLEDSRVYEATIQSLLSLPDADTLLDREAPPLPENFERSAEDPECFDTKFYPDGHNRWATDHWTERDWRLYRWAYARLTERVDREIGLILDGLDQSGLGEETIVVFTSDHGEMEGAHRLVKKSVLYDESARVPLIVRGPGTVPSGRVDSSSLVSNGIDLMPTLLDYAGLEIPGDRPGRSLRPVLEGRAQSFRDALVIESPHGRALRTATAKYCVYSDGRNREQLFDAAADPGERRNLIDDPASAGLATSCRTTLAEQLREADDPVGLAILAGTTSEEGTR